MRRLHLHHASLNGTAGVRQESTVAYVGRGARYLYHATTWDLLKNAVLGALAFLVYSGVRPLCVAFLIYSSARPPLCMGRTSFASCTHRVCCVSWVP